MAKIYTAPDSIVLPKLDFANVAQYRTDCDKYIEDLKAFALKRNNSKNVGETIQFPVADGYAQYMVLGMKPLELVHIPLWDAWDYQYVNRLTAKDVNEKIAGQKAMEKLFPAKK